MLFTWIKNILIGLEAVVIIDFPNKLLYRYLLILSIKIATDEK